MGLEMWSARAQQYGRRAVGDLNIPEDHFDAATDMQWDILWPLLQGAMGDWRPRTALDFGCGMGRFTGLLRRDLNRFVVGYEPCVDILTLADPDPAIEYTAEPPPGSFDLIFCSYVLGGLEGSDLTDACAYVSGALDRLLFLAEHIGEGGSENWRFRSEAEYAAMFAAVGVKLRRIGTYLALGNEIGVFEGRPA